MLKIINKKLVTRWKDNHVKEKLFTQLEDDQIDKIGSKDILVRMIFVSTHGSFWLATHPNAIHPRKNEFLHDGSFTFGNGGVAEVIGKGKKLKNIEIGDYVCVFGHYPCKNSNCYSCNHNQKYIECDYEQGKIIGHGNKASDGTFSKFVVLPEHSWAKCYSKADNPTIDDLKPLMFSYLIADVRNALIKNSVFYDSNTNINNS